MQQGMQRCSSSVQQQQAQTPRSVSRTRPTHRHIVHPVQAQAADDNCGRDNVQRQLLNTRAPGHTPVTGGGQQAAQAPALPPPTHGLRCPAPAAAARSQDSSARSGWAARRARWGMPRRGSAPGPAWRARCPHGSAPVGRAWGGVRMGGGVRPRKEACRWPQRKERQATASPPAAPEAQTCIPPRRAHLHARAPARQPLGNLRPRAAQHHRRAKAAPAVLQPVEQPLSHRVLQQPGAGALAVVRSWRLRERCVQAAGRRRRRRQAGGKQTHHQRVGP